MLPGAPSSISLGPNCKGSKNPTPLGRSDLPPFLGVGPWLLKEKPLGSAAPQAFALGGWPKPLFFGDFRIFPLCKLAVDLHYYFDRNSPFPILIIIFNFLTLSLTYCIFILRNYFAVVISKLEGDLCFSIFDNWKA